MPRVISWRIIRGLPPVVQEDEEEEGRRRYLIGCTN